MRISDWSSDVCSSDLFARAPLLPSSCCAYPPSEPWFRIAAAGQPAGVQPHSTIAVCSAQPITRQRCARVKSWAKVSFEEPDCSLAHRPKRHAIFFGKGRCNSQNGVLVGTSRGNQACFFPLQAEPKRET